MNRFYKREKRPFLIERIRRHEGFRRTPYEDSLGNRTVGWGHRLAAGEVPQETTAGLEILFIRDLAEALAGADAFIQHSPHKDKLHPAAFGIVLEMAFNLGFPRLIQFKKFREAIFALDYRAAAREMLDSRWAGQVGPRARRLAKLMEGLARVTG